MRALRFLIIGALSTAALLGQAKEYPVGYTDTPIIPGMEWRVHDIARPHPRIITPGTATKAPSDAIVLFDGKDLSHWLDSGRGPNRQVGPPRWNLGDGYFEVAAGTGSLISKQRFGDMQLHLEFSTPAKVEKASQGRGNSGVLIMGLYEIQVLDSYDNLTYADGQASAIYGQYPPLVNAARPPGEWQTYDIIFEAPRFDGDELEKSAYVTVLHNGVLTHHRQKMLGPMRHKVNTYYEAHDAEGPIMLQQHSNPTRYRNIWVRKLDKVQQ